MVRMSISSSRLSQMIARLRRGSVPSYEELVKDARASRVVGLDESDHRQDGAAGWKPRGDEGAWRFDGLAWT